MEREHRQTSNGRSVTPPKSRSGNHAVHVRVALAERVGHLLEGRLSRALSLDGSKLSRVRGLRHETALHVVLN
jgi:hypothetical protein